MAGGGGEAAALNHALCPSLILNTMREIECLQKLHQVLSDFMFNQLLKEPWNVFIRGFDLKWKF